MIKLGFTVYRDISKVPPNDTRVCLALDVIILILIIILLCAIML